ncbi:MAG TPA: DHA2 family efflux MFS transporter permease subunit [Ilumatobacteraceae bacterium]|nr:DHA2 family efflux MFS transporter permease subunit [Ilumatobacteraceae bacterium]
MSVIEVDERVSAPDDVPADAAASRRAGRWILAAMCAALVAVVASVSGLNVATEALANDLGASQSQLLWVINGYTIALAALLLPIGAIGDRWGRKKVLIVGLVVFVAANLAAAFATSMNMLLVTRVIGGVAAAMIMPVTLSVITSTFAAEERDRAVGVWAGFAGAGGILGLFASAFVIDHASWPWVFALPTVLAVVALAMTVMVVPHSREDHTGRFDTVGAVLSVLAIGGLVMGIQEGPERGWFAPLTAFGLVIGGVCLAAFIVYELRHRHPLLAVRVFRNRLVSAGSITLVVLFAVMMGIFLTLVQFLQSVAGFSALGAAAGLLPMAMLMMPLSSIAPLIARKVGFRAMFVIGSVFTALGLALIAIMASATGGYLSILPGLLVVSVGVGLLMTPSTTAITSGLPLEEQGVASALNDTVREFGGALGIALLGSLVSSGYRSGVAGILGQMPPQAAEAVNQGIGGASIVARHAGPQGEALMTVARGAFVDGWTTAMWVSAGLMVVCGLVLATLTPKRTRND